MKDGGGRCEKMMMLVYVFVVVGSDFMVIGFGIFVVFEVILWLVVYVIFGGGSVRRK